MNKKRYLIIIAIIILIFLALFTFANPLNNGEGEPNDNRVLEEIEEDDVINQNDEKTEEEKEDNVVDGPMYNDHGVNVDNIKQPEEDDKEEEKQPEEDDEEEELKPIVPDNSYELALNAVIKAEIILSDEKYEIASDLVERVTDETKKEELTKRLETVLEIIDLKNDIKVLVDDVRAADSKSDLVAARIYKEENNIEERLSKLENEVIKELLQEKLDSIAYLLDDIKEPTINIEDGAMLNKESDKTIEVTDESDVTIILNGTEIESGYEISQDGDYELTVTDVAFNSKTINFVVDTKDPVANVAYSNENATNEDVTVTITFDEEIQAVEGWELSEDKKVLTQTFTENIENAITVKDLVGNTIQVNYSINNIDKVINEPQVTYSNENATNEPVTVTITFDEEIQAVEGWTLTNGNVLTQTFTESAFGTITVKDLANNSIDVNYSVEHIDVVPPTNETPDNVLESIYNSIFGVYTFSEDVIISYGDIVLTTEYSTEFDVERSLLFWANDEYELTATDRAGNSITFTAYMKKID